MSRTRVSAIRAVNVDGVMKTLVTRGLVTEVGHDAESGAVLYATTEYFLQRLGISSWTNCRPWPTTFLICRISIPRTHRRILTWTASDCRRSLPRQGR